jgi:hypothetical protein
LSIVNDFDGRCAYCRTAPGDTIDHFIPLSHGGETAPWNCVPACKLCNGARTGPLPKWAQPRRYPEADELRVEKYLARRLMRRRPVPVTQQEAQQETTPPVQEEQEEVVACA